MNRGTRLEGKTALITGGARGIGAASARRFVEEGEALVAELNAKRADSAYGNYPLGRMADALEVADMVVFLASDESSFCTGGDFVVDGGVSAGKPRA